jgi:branched-chain amino acid transport system substrate-binding protein
MGRLRPVVHGVVAMSLAILVSGGYALGDETLRIGEIVGLTGPVAAYGKHLHNSRLLAVEEINAKGGITVAGKKYKLEVAILDVGPPAEGLKAFERMLSVEKTPFILDGLYSSLQYALGPVLRTKDAMMIWSAGSDPGTTVGVPNAFRNTFDGGAPLMKVTEEFVRKTGVKRIAAYGQNGHAEFKRFVDEYLPKLPGVEVVAKEWHPFGEKDFFPVLTKFKSLKPDMIMAHGFYADGLTMLKQAREIGLLPGPIWLSQYAVTPMMLDSSALALLEGTYENLISAYAPMSDPPAKSKRFFEAYVKRFGEKGFGPWGEAGYDSVYILAKAMEKAGSVDDVKKVIKAMNALTTSDIPELVAQYKEGKLFDEHGQAYPKIIVAQWKAGKLVPVLANWGH